MGRWWRRRGRVGWCVVCCVVGLSLVSGSSSNAMDEVDLSIGDCKNENLLDECKDNACFIVLDEDPFISLPPKESRDPKIFKERRPFPCHEYRKNNMSGISFELLEPWFRNESEKGRSRSCYYGGDDCTWNALVNYVTFNGGEGPENFGNYSLILLGSLLETPKRLKMGTIPSASYADDRLSVVGLKGEVRDDTFGKLVQPFDISVWLMVMVQGFLGFIVGILLKYSNPLRAPHVRTSDEWIRFHCFDTLVLGLSVVLGNEGALDGEAATVKKDQVVLQYDFPGEQTAAGARSQIAGGKTASAGGALLRAPPAGGARRRKKRALYYRLEIYHLKRVIFTVTMALFVGTALIFYEAALTTNFLFESRTPTLSQPVTNLTDEQLRDYSVLTQSAVRDVFVKLQSRNRNGRGPVTLTECADIDKCFELVRKRASRYLVVQRNVARFKIRQDDACKELVIYDTQQPLFFFNAGLIYGPKTSKELREEIDMVFLRSRVNGARVRIMNKYLDQADCNNPLNFISWDIYRPAMILIGGTLGIIVFLQLLMWAWNERGRGKRRQMALVVVRPQPSAFAGQSTSLSTQASAASSLLTGLSRRTLKRRSPSDQAPGGA